MSREADLSQISDGKKYHAQDCVKINCNDCKGCSACCKGMGDSIVLDPYDIYNLQKGLNCDFSSLIAQKRIALHVSKGVIVPHLLLSGENEACTFLNESGRCSIHDFRPGFCRLFPLGRAYEEDSFYYFYQVNECTYPNKSKIKIKDWLSIPKLPEYEAYILEWHKIISNLETIISDYQSEAEQTKEMELIHEKISKLNLMFLEIFYVNPYDGNASFYEQFVQRDASFVTRSVSLYH
ncbi:MAG: YkgJ family cysteine cluster protein [Lachnospiraceae bacterium]|nr:YkgJ family cysteine cluster protein [Lachnospiraceae bacterium]